MFAFSQDSFRSRIYPRYMRFWTSIALVPLCLLAFGSIAYGQSTFGAVLGTVRDSSGSVIQKAKIELVNTGTNAGRNTESTLDGTYKFVLKNAGGDNTVTFATTVAK